MKGKPNDFWGKLRRDEQGRVVEWHPLIDHCADVAACTEALLSTGCLSRALARLAGVATLRRELHARLAVLAAFHDIGKFSTAFQNKGFAPATPVAGHVREVLALFDDLPSKEQKLLCDSLPLTSFDAWSPDDGALRLLVASICHHGRPHRAGGTPQRAFWTPRRGLDPFDGIRRLSESVQRWFPEAFATSTAPLPNIPAFQHGFSGLVMLADWLGSDIRFFPYTEMGCSDRVPLARQRSRLALRETHIDVTADRVALGRDPVSFSALAPFSPHRIQRHLLELPAAREGSLVLLESETGSGKTEAALARFLRLFQAGQVDGLYFALPTRTAATQIHRRVVGAVATAFPREEHRPPVILAVPGYISFDRATGYRLPGFEVLWNDDPDQRFRYRGWAAEHPKRYLAGTVVVGTIDQVLLSTLMVGHAHMRATALFRHLLIVDEVHASDVYMITLLRAVLENHLAAGGHAVLMSATLGSAARSRLVSIISGTAEKPATLETEARQPYPLVTYCAHGTCRGHGPSSNHTQKRVRQHLRPWMTEAEPVARAALDAASRGARVIVLRNTVSDCVATQRQVEQLAQASSQQHLLFRCQSTVTPHHARFAKEDRELLDEALEESFGKNSPSRSCVAVTTQTVQQSLDIDADLLITDLCPMDILFQRLGRLQRHQRTRPSDFAEPVVLILTPKERDLAARIDSKGTTRGGQGIGTVYDDLRIIEATWRLLLENELLEIPRMNRMLVEKATHPAALDAIVHELGGAWATHAAWVTGASAAQKQMALLNQIDRAVPFGERGTEFPSDGLERRIQTRLGEGDRIAELEAQVNGPFGSPIRYLTVPAYLAREVPADAVPALVRVTPGLIAFRFGTRLFIYDRLGLRLAPERNDDVQEDPADA